MAHPLQLETWTTSQPCRILASAAIPKLCVNAGVGVWLCRVQVDFRDSAFILISAQSAGAFAPKSSACSWSI